jgi:hypothetical protein
VPEREARSWGSNLSGGPSSLPIAGRSPPLGSSARWRRRLCSGLACSRSRVARGPEAMQGAGGRRLAGRARAAFAEASPMT